MDAVLLVVVVVVGVVVDFGILGEHADMLGKCVLRCLTVAKHQGPYARNQTERHWLPPITGRVCLQHAFTDTQTDDQPTREESLITATL